jgi:glucose/arabinose dehydrogenase
VGESSPQKYTYFAKSKVEFQEFKLYDFAKPSKVAFGPDGKLYVGTVDGQIAKLTLDDNYNVVDAVVATVSKWRVILGITFDPMDTSPNPTVYFTNWQFYHGEEKSTSGNAINGKVSRAKGANLDIVEDIVTGLPVADGDHGLSGLVFGDRGELYIQVGSNTNGGVPGRTSGSQKQKENPLSATTLVAYLSRPNFKGFMTYTKDDDGDLNSGFDVEVFAAGQRNPLGIVLHSNGNLYATDNGPDVGFGDMAQGCNGQVIDDVEEEDKLNLLVKGGYYGHPNMKRGSTDSRQCVWRSPREQSSNGFTAPIAIVPSSTNGMVEFQSDHFDGQLRGNLITSKYTDGLYRIILTPDGKGVEPESKVPIELAGDATLDVTQHPDGTLFDARLPSNAIHYYKPVETDTSTVVVKSVYPRRGGVAGGSKLTIYGKNLDKNGNTKVKVGNNDCVIRSASAKKVECTLPGGSGTVDVSLTTGVETSTFKRGYRYISGF